MAPGCDAIIGDGKLIHLITSMHDAFGGTENRAAQLFNQLAARTEVSLWSVSPPHGAFAGRVPIQIVDVARGAIPRRGTFILVGTAVRYGGWLKLARPEKVFLIHNVPNPGVLQAQLALIRTAGNPPVTVVAASSALRDEAAGLVDGPVPVLPSSIDIEAFPEQVRPERPFTIGRHSRDVPEKFHVEDLDLFRMLAEAGVRVRLMGGTCLARSLRHPNIELLPVGAMPVAEFLASLDAFVYRTADSWFEAWGRVVAEAMLTGLPIIAGRRGGYVDFVGPDTGILFESTDEACAAVLALRDDPFRRRRMGEAGRAAMLELLGPRLEDQVARIFLSKG